MASVCTKLLKSTFILPFVAGNYLRRPQGPQYYDCSISSRVLFLVLVSLVTVFTANSGIHRHEEVRLATVLILQSVILMCAMIAIFRLGWLVKTVGIRSVVAKRRHTSIPKLQIIFLWMFGISSGSYCALFISKQIECFLLNATGGLFWNVVFYFNIVLILSIFVQMVFVSYFSPFELKQTPAVNFVMFLLLTANFVVMLYIYFMNRTLQSAIDFDPEGGLPSCIQNNSTISILMLKSHQFLSPSSLEFTLLSITMLLEIWSLTPAKPADDKSRDRNLDSNYVGSRDRHVDVGESLSYNRSRVDDEYDGGSRDRRVNHDNDGSRDIHVDDGDRVDDDYDDDSRDQHDTEWTPLLNSINGLEQHDTEWTPLLNSINGLEQPIIRSRRRWRVSHIATLIVSLTVGIGLIICYIAQIVDDIGNLEQLQSVTVIYEQTIIVIMVSVQLVGFFCLSHHCVPKKSAKPLRPRDYVYLLSAFGLITFHFYDIIGGDGSTDFFSHMLLYKSITSIVQDYLQVVFLLQANRCQKSRPSISLIESVLICIMIMNLICWFASSFLVHKFPITRDLGRSNFPKNLLRFLYDVLLPVSVFFRFTSFLEYYATFEEYSSR
ncbi:uncharacterized protein [Argopecten irradians]|uniref:uncharacterized protein n=1 Tax=Argopecten irradians TaxID=31199 RepID=UPI00371BF5C7